MNKKYILYLLFTPINHLLRSQKFYKKLTALLCNFAIILNSFLPYISAIPAHAQEAELSPSPTEIVENIPTVEPTLVPTVEVTPVPSIEPTLEPTIIPTIVPTVAPVEDLKADVTIAPTLIPTITEDPIATPSAMPSEVPVDNSNQNSDSNNNSSNNDSTISSSPTVIPSPTNIPTPIFSALSGQIETVVVENNSCRTDVLNPILSSDKGDYSPTEIAIISGHGFLTNAEYKLKISSEGPEGTSSINETYTINTDSEGNFTYSYQLDGNYRPNYIVEAFDLSGALITSLAFTDSLGFPPPPPKSDTLTVITSDNPDPSNINQGYSVNVKVSRLNNNGTPSGMVTISNGVNNCTANLSGSNGISTGFCNLTSTTSGVKTITAIYTGDSNFNTSSDTESHTVNFNKANQTINFSSISNKTYGDTPFTLNATATSGLAVSFNVISGPATISGNILTIIGTGTVTVRASQSGDSNYNAASNVDRSFTINKATPVITWSDPADIIYGTALSSAQLNANVNIGGTYVYSRSLGTILHAGDNQPLSVTFYPTDKTNYNNATKTVYIDVNKAPLTVTADPQNKVYGNFDPFFTYKFFGFVNGDDKYDLDWWPFCYVSVSHYDVGTYPITCSGASDNNYTFQYVSGNLVVNKRQLTVHLSINNKVYDGDTSAVISSQYLTGILGYDHVSLIGGTAFFDTKDVGVSKTVTVSGLSLSGSDANNYNIDDSIVAYANITPKLLTVVADSNQSKTVGNLDPLFTYSSETLVVGDTLSGLLGRFTGEEVGTYAITLGTLTAGDNYSIGFTSADFTINPQNNSSSDSSSNSSSPGAPVCNDSIPNVAPTNFRAVAGINSVTLYWDKPDTNFSYYLIAYSDQPSADKYGNPNIGGPNTTSYTVGDLSAGTTYYFKIRTGNGCAPGPFSTIVSATPGGKILTNATPSGFEPGVLGTQSTENTSPLGSASSCTPIFPFVFVLALIVNLILSRYRLLTFFVSLLSLLFDYLINKYSCIKHPYFYFANIVAFLLPLIISFRK